MYGMMRVEFETEDPKSRVEVRVEVTFPAGSEEDAAGMVMEAASAVSAQIKQD